MAGSRKLLKIEDHSRDSAGMTYVYPVLSRRAGGVSVGINLNPNNACNWRCIYCQVPDLKRGGPPTIDLVQLGQELERMLDSIVGGDFMDRQVPAEARRLVDIAFSGNGEPTSAAEFAEAVGMVSSIVERRGLAGSIVLRLITNGSLVDRVAVREGIARLGEANGEVWFKLDRATPAGIAGINSVAVKPGTALRRLRTCAGLCRTWVQTCVFAVDGAPPSPAERAAYVELIERAADVIAGVHLYGLARPSLQPEAPRLSQVPTAWIEDLAARLRSLGLTVTVNP